MFANTYHQKRVLVTGHTGFKGAWLATWLLELGAEVHGLADGVPTQPSLYEVLGLGQRLRHHEGDVRDFGLVKKIVETVRPHFIFHLAAQAIVKRSLDSPLDTLTVNLLGHAHLMEAVRQLGQPCVMVMVTSDKCYENREKQHGYTEADPLGGDDPYSASKAAAELAVKAWQRSFFSGENSTVRIATARAGNVIGGGDWAEGRIVPDCIRAWSEGRPVHLRRPQATRPWQHVLEPLSGYLRVGQMLVKRPELNGEVFNFGPEASQNHTVLDLVSHLSTQWPLPDILENLIVEKEAGFQEANLLRLDCEKANQLLDWQSVLCFDEAVNLTSDWYHEYYKNPARDIYRYTIEQYLFYQKLALEKGAKWTFFK